VSATRTWQRPSGDRKFCFGLAEMEVLSGGRNVAANAPVTAGDSTEGWGWSAKGLTDGLGILAVAKGEAAPEPGRAGPDDPLRRLLEGQAPEDPGHAAVILRKEFTVDRPVRRAIAAMCGLGWSELYLDGARVGDAVLSPAFSSYGKSVNYVVHDLTASLAPGRSRPDLRGPDLTPGRSRPDPRGPDLTPGRHAVGVVLGNGWFNTPSKGYHGIYTGKSWSGYPRLLLDVLVEHQDGTVQRIVSDESWKWSVNEITYNCGWAGENVDMRLAKPGWNRAGYDDANWRQAVGVDGPSGRLMAQAVPAIRVSGSHSSEGPTLERRGADATFALPFMSAGWPRVAARGPAGHVLAVSWDGMHNTFTLSGKGLDVYEPRFTYKSIQRVGVGGLVPEVTDLSVGVQAVHTDMQRFGEFSCSDQRLNDLMDVLWRTVENYMFDFPQDPTREKSGWTQDVETGMEISIYMQDACAMYRNWFKDFREAQRPDGYVPCCAPGDFDYGGYNGPWWGGMIVWGPWHHYLYYGDRLVLEENYAAMKAMVDYMGTRTKGDFIVTWGLGDWLCPDKNHKAPVPMTSTAAYALYATIVSRTARLLGRSEDADAYAALAAKVRDAFNGAWFDEASGWYGSRESSKGGAPGRYQTMQALAWSLDLAPAHGRDAVLQRLVDDIVARKNHLNTGFIGTRYLLAALMDSGQDDLLYALATQPTAPSWISSVRGGVFMENWGGGGVQMPSCAGNIGQYFFRGLGGIQPDPAGPGFEKIVIRPSMPGGLAWVKCRHQTPRGPVVSNWRRDGTKVVMEVCIPQNASATVFVPAGSAASVQEGARPLTGARGVELLRCEGGRAVLSVGSGRYEFTGVLP
jgi:alpha-L-rhamnosidase